MGNKFFISENINIFGYLGAGGVGGSISISYEFSPIV